MLSVSRTIAAPPDVVWGLLVEIDAWPRWGPTVGLAWLDDRATQIHEGSTGQGAAGARAGAAVHDHRVRARAALVVAGRRDPGDHPRGGAGGSRHAGHVRRAAVGAGVPRGLRARPPPAGTAGGACRLGSPCDRSGSRVHRLRQRGDLPLRQPPRRRGLAQGPGPRPPPLDQLQRPDRREARRGGGRPRRDHRLRRVVRERRLHPRVRRLVGARQRGVQEPAREPVGRPGPALPGLGHQERRRHPARRRRRRGPRPAPRALAPGVRGRRLRLRAARAAVQADGPVRRRDRRRRVDQQRAGVGVQRVHRLRRPARRLAARLRARRPRPPRRRGDRGDRDRAEATGTVKKTTRKRTTKKAAADHRVAGRRPRPPRCCCGPSGSGCRSPTTSGSTPAA